MSDPVTRQEQLLSAIATGGDIISPVTREEMYLAYMAGDTSVVLPEPITRKEQFLYQACLTGGGGGGAAITDGIVVKARDADGYATEVDFYGTVVERYQFGQGSDNTAGFMRLKKVNYKSACTTIKEGAFAQCGKNSESPAPIPETLTEIEANAFRGTKYISAEFPISLTGRLPDNLFAYSTVVKTIKAPGITSLDTSGGGGNGQFLSCTGLENCEIGSIGYGVTFCATWNFKNCTQTGLTITIYTTGAYADTALTNIRNGATNATIIIKASEDTTYNGTSYAAGETMITSTVEGSA